MNTFSKVDVDRILNLPLPAEGCEDLIVWTEELYEEFSVRSYYKLLQKISLEPTSYAIHNEARKSYRKLWGVNIPTKIKVKIWWFSYNFLPTLMNLNMRNLLVNICCPRCGRVDETTDHLFRYCLMSKDVWSDLKLSDRFTRSLNARFFVVLCG